MASGLGFSPVGRRLTFRRCQIGFGNHPDGFAVSFGGRLIAVVQSLADGSCTLAAGFAPPFATMNLEWSSAADLQADFVEVARLYRAGHDPDTIEYFTADNGSLLLSTRPGAD